MSDDAELKARLVAVRERLAANMRTMQDFEAQAVTDLATAQDALAGAQSQIPIFQAVVDRARKHVETLDSSRQQIDDLLQSVVAAIEAIEATP
jgi:ABC-type transporter Mla subunit MlaD